MPENLEKAPIRNGLRDITVEEFWKYPLIMSRAVDAKLQRLPVNQNTMSGSGRSASRCHALSSPRMDASAGVSPRRFAEKAPVRRTEP